MEWERREERRTRIERNKATGWTERETIWFSLLLAWLRF